MNEVYIFFVWFLSGGCFPSGSSDPPEVWFDRHLKGVSYRGVITNKVIDRWQRGEKEYYLNNGIKYAFKNGAAYDIAEPGDSIIKMAGTLGTVLKKRDTTIVFLPCIENKPLKDK